MDDKDKSKAEEVPHKEHPDYNPFAAEDDYLRRSYERTRLETWNGRNSPWNKL